MIKILFVCHGNICRSPMAEFIFNYIAAREGLGGTVTASSAGTSSEELGNPVYPQARSYLKKIGIDASGKYARQMTEDDFREFDLIIAMEKYNVRAMMRFCPQGCEEKIKLLRDYTGSPGDIEDPWYTGNFNIVGQQIEEGCRGLLERIRNNRKGSELIR